jgi:hypothetical protein
MPWRKPTEATFSGDYESVNSVLNLINRPCGSRCVTERDNFYQIPLLTDPGSTNMQVDLTTSGSIHPYTDPYFRGYDNSFPVFYPYQGWARDFDPNYANGGLPILSQWHIGRGDKGCISP